MSKIADPPKLPNGTVIRHKTAGYTGCIDGITEMRECFTAAGKLLSGNSAKQTFQYRIVVPGDSMRRIAPEDDLEILRTVGRIVCHNCHASFQANSRAAGKSGGLCQCGCWICPECLSCQENISDAAERGIPPCTAGRKRLLRKLALNKKRNTRPA